MNKGVKPVHDSRCPGCPGQRTLVQAEGGIVPVNGLRILFLGEAPGIQEDRQGRPFCGDTGRELDRLYLPLAGLERGGVRVGNVVACLPPLKAGKHTPSPALARACGEWWLPGELADSQPDIIVPLGAVACSMFGVDLELEHGRPVVASPFWNPARSYILFPLFHPARGLHEPRFLTMLRDDFQALGEFIREWKWPAEDGYPKPVYELAGSADHLASIFERDAGRANGRIAADTEWDEASGDHAPHCLSFSMRPGTGTVIMASRPDLCGLFSSLVEDNGLRFVLHSAPADLPNLKRMRVEVKGNWIDTMEMAYTLQNSAQSLKQLAYRLCGMRMEEYEDVVTPYADDAVTAWLVGALARGRELHPAKGKPVPLERRIAEILRARGIRVGKGRKPPWGRMARGVVSLYRKSWPFDETGERGIQSIPGLDTQRALFPEMEAGETWGLVWGELGREAARKRAGPPPWKPIELFLGKGAPSAWKWWRKREAGLKEMAGQWAGGPAPGRSITLVPERVLVRYAGRDADATGRIYGPLAGMQRGIRASWG